ncbi:MAG: hypothetical protein R3E87_20720 [Burkholderiaceae bacterium]
MREADAEHELLIHPNPEISVMKIAHLVFVVALFGTTNALAEWTVSPQPSFVGKGYNVSNGRETVVMPDEKSARKAARALNKADKKAAKKSGFKAEEDGPCARPQPNMNC